MLKKFFAAFILATLVFAADASAGRFVAAPAAQGIPNRYLVLLADSPVHPGFKLDGLPPMPEVAREIAGDYGLRKPLRLYEHAVRGFLVEMSEAAARRLARDPRIARVEQDQVIEVQAPQCPDVSFEAASTYPASPQSVPCLISAASCHENWGLDRIDQAQLPLNSAFYFSNVGTGVNIYFLDTGLDYYHSEFKNASGVSRVGNGINFGKNGNNTVDPNNYYDEYGHGTHVAAIAAGLRYGVAKNATLHPVRVTDNQAQSSTSIVASGVDWIAHNHVKPAIVNISMNFKVAREVVVDPAGLNFMEQAFHNLVTTYGVAVVNSAGNFNTDAVDFSPSRLPELIVVGATDNADARWAVTAPGQPCYLRSDPYSQCGSNFGPYVDLFAPGFQIVSAWTNTSTRTGACQQTGTSLSAPLVTGTAATYLQTHPLASPAEISQALINNATAGVLYPQGLGAGSPNRMLKTF
jgi:hypothetical protein